VNTMGYQPEQVPPYKPSIPDNLPPPDRAFVSKTTSTGENPVNYAVQPAVSVPAVTSAPPPEVPASYVNPPVLAPVEQVPGIVPGFTPGVVPTPGVAPPPEVNSPYGSGSSTTPLKMTTEPAVSTLGIPLTSIPYVPNVVHTPEVNSPYAWESSTTAPQMTTEPPVPTPVVAPPYGIPGTPGTPGIDGTPGTPVCYFSLCPPF
jgi:hypothetical protein